MQDEKNIVLEHELIEWQHLNNYVIEIEKGFSTHFTIMLVLFTGILLVTISPSDARQNTVFVLGGSWRIVLLTVLPAVVLDLGYLAYQFRIIAIIRGHLAQLETSINSTIGKDVHMWNSYLYESYMAHNNFAYQFLVIPAGIVIMFIVLISIFSVYELVLGSDILPLFKTISYECRQSFFVIYLLITLVPGIIIACTFVTNERIRKRTKDVKHVKRLYQIYMTCEEKKVCDGKSSIEKRIDTKIDLVSRIRSTIIKIIGKK